MESIILDTQLTPTERVLMATLIIRPDSNLSEVARLTGVKKPNVSMYMKRLQEKGRVSIEKVGNTRRFALIN